MFEHILVRRTASAFRLKRGTPQIVEISSQALFFACALIWR